MYSRTGNGILGDAENFFDTPYAYLNENIENIKNSITDRRLSHRNPSSGTVIDDFVDLLGVSCLTVSLLPTLLIGLPFLLIHGASFYAFVQQGVERGFISHSTAEFCHISLTTVLSIALCIPMLPFAFIAGVLTSAGCVASALLWGTLRILSASIYALTKNEESIETPYSAVRNYNNNNSHHVFDLRETGDTSNNNHEGSRPTPRGQFNFEMQKRPL